MNTYRSAVRELFGHGERPNKDALVSWDGFDQLDKESAVSFYAGLSWEDVLANLRNGGTYELEEWGVLCSDALFYYARAHLEYLIETVESESPDDGFVAKFFHELYQLVYAHKGSPFKEKQTTLLVNLAHAVQSAAIERDLEYLLDDYVQNNIERFLEQLASNG